MSKRPRIILTSQDLDRLDKLLNGLPAVAFPGRIELQADCYSGIWARHAQERFGTIEPGDLEEAVNAAHRIGDDTLQRNAGRVPMPHTFTHGTSEQRARWFATGYKTGDMRSCDTFGTDDI